MREEQGLSLKALAGGTGLSSSFLSRVELGRTLPSLLTLHAIADALHVDIESLFSKGEDQRFVVSKRKRRRRLYLVKGLNQKTCYEMELLAEDMANPLMEPALVTALLGNREDLVLASHGGQEFCYVLEGQVEVILGKQSFVLEPGDAAYWDGNIPHGAVRHGNNLARTLNVHLVPGKRTGTFQTYDKGQ